MPGRRARRRLDSCDLLSAHARPHRPRPWLRPSSGCVQSMCTVLGRTPLLSPHPPTLAASHPYAHCPRRDDNLISPCYHIILHTVCPQRARGVRTLQSVCALSLAARRPPSAARSRCPVAFTVRSRLRRIGPSICLACHAWIPRHDHRCLCSCCCSPRWLRPPAGPAGCYPPKALPSESCVSSCLRATDEREASTPTALPRGHALGQKTWFRVTC